MVAPCRKRIGDAAPRVENFGDLMRAVATLPENQNGLLAENALLQSCQERKILMI